MKFRVLLIALIASATMAGEAFAQSCNRGCLLRALDQYLGAVVANDPSRAPLFAGFRQTENAVVKATTDGVWRSVTGLGEFQRRYADPVTGNAGFFGVLREGDGLAIATLRLRVERGEITEAEWHIGRPTDPGITGPPSRTLFDAENLTRNGPPQRVVPPAQRLSRERLIAITNSYFDGITSHNGRLVQAHGGCIRLENGQVASGGRLPPDRLDDGFEGMGDCTSGYANFDVVLVAGRRYVVVDEVSQTVQVTVTFIRQPGTPKRRNHFTEVFYIDGDKIRGVYAAMFYADPRLPVPNWPPYEGNFPLPGLYPPSN